MEGARAEGLSDADLRRWLADQGVVAVGLEPVLSWLPPDALPPEARSLAGPPPETFFAMAEALGVPAIVAADGFGAVAPRAALSDAFARLCDDAARYGLRVKLEFTPWSAIPDATTAWEIVREARPDAGLMVDAWHHYRGGGDLDAIWALPGDRVTGVQLNDAPAQRSDESPSRESMRTGTYAFPASAAAAGPQVT